MKVRFGSFILDLDTRLLTEDAGEVHISPKAFELLAALVIDRPRVLSKAQLQQRLWPVTFVAEANLSNLVAELRRVLRDAPRTPRFIRTAHGFGYAFCAEATDLAAASDATTDGPRCWIEWNGRRFPLADGENVAGRDPDATVRLDASTVSRRHARFVVSHDRAWLEDAGSKNGTFHSASRVTSSVELKDGDTIHIGSVLVTFHVRSALGSTDTVGSSI